MKSFPLTRRCFLTQTASALGFAGGATVGGPWLSLASGPANGGGRLAQTKPTGTNALRQSPAFTGGTLKAQASKLELWPGRLTDVLALNGSVPGPTIRITIGGLFSTLVENQLSEPLVLHWHGLLAPAAQDGHPRDALAPGRSAMIRFPVNQRAGTYWYHAHTDMLTGKQAYQGLAGLFLVEDPAEAALGLPTGDHDVPVLLADKRPNASHQLPYAPTMMDVAGGWLGTEVLANGVPNAYLAVDTGTYRLRLVNASNARVFRVGLDDLAPFQLIANDAGLLPAPVTVSTLMLPPGGRVEILVGFAGRSLASLVKLVSHAYVAPAGHGGMTGGLPQGAKLDLLLFSVERPVPGAPTLPATLVPFLAHAAKDARRTRKFSLGMSMGMGGGHQINGAAYNLQRVDFTVPQGELEIWEFTDTLGDFHPMHLHGAHFQVLSRGGVAALPPEDSGWKDTVLVGPLETVRVLVRFDDQAGIFVLHCHNLEHEDDGMMQNFEVTTGTVVEPSGPPLLIEHTASQVHLSWPSSATGYQLQTRDGVGPALEWQTVGLIPERTGDRWQLRVEATATAQFFRLLKL
jgi:FtsP/CotA-like multicopper oxidase with cupredoxin domain